MNLSGGNASKLASDMFPQILADRFHLAMRAENKAVPVYELVVARGGPKLSTHTFQIASSISRRMAATALSQVSAIP
jgi:uncharacterized protein (TIGR03435 family)